MVENGVNNQPRAHTGADDSCWVGLLCRERPAEVQDAPNILISPVLLSSSSPPFKRPLPAAASETHRAGSSRGESRKWQSNQGRALWEGSREAARARQERRRATRAVLSSPCKGTLPIVPSKLATHLRLRSISRHTTVLLGFCSEHGCCSDQKCIHTITTQAPTAPIPYRIWPL